MLTFISPQQPVRSFERARQPLQPQLFHQSSESLPRCHRGGETLPEVTGLRNLRIKPVTPIGKSKVSVYSVGCDALSTIASSFGRFSYENNSVHVYRNIDYNIVVNNYIHNYILTKILETIYGISKIIISMESYKPLFDIYYCIYNNHFKKTNY